MAREAQQLWQERMNTMTKEQMANAIGELRGTLAWVQRVASARHTDPGLALRRIADEIRIALGDSEAMDAARIAKAGAALRKTHQPWHSYEDIARIVIEAISERK